METPSLTIHFPDIEPGWSCIYFSQPPRLTKSRLHSLISSLESWRQKHPMRRIVQVQVVKSNGTVRGSNVLWSFFEHLQEASKIAHFNIDEDVRDLYGHEYVEALMHDALGFATENQSPEKSVVLVSRRRIAMKILRPEGQAYITTFENFLSTVNPSLGSELSVLFADWQNKNEQGYFCAVLPNDHR